MAQLSTEKAFSAVVHRVLHQERRGTPQPKNHSPLATLWEKTFPDSMSDEEVLSNFSDMLKCFYVFKFLKSRRLPVENAKEKICEERKKKVFF
jgi:hypothetical protein